MLLPAPLREVAIPAGNGGNLAWRPRHRVEPHLEGAIGARVHERPFTVLGVPYLDHPRGQAPAPRGEDVEAVHAGGDAQRLIARRVRVDGGDGPHPLPLAGGVEVAGVEGIGGEDGGERPVGEGVPVVDHQALAVMGLGHVGELPGQGDVLHRDQPPVVLPVGAAVHDHLEILEVRGALRDVPGHELRALVVLGADVGGRGSDARGARGTRRDQERQQGGGSTSPTGGSRAVWFTGHGSPLSWWPG